jgi:predicted DNA-binding mobile mystery protein A
MRTQRPIARRRLDDTLALVKGPLSRPAIGWVRAIRESLGMSELDLAIRIGISQPRVNQIQRAEIDGSVQLSTLSRVARGLNCELVYYLDPKHPLEEMTRQQAFIKAAEEVGYDPGHIDQDPHGEMAASRREAEALTSSWVDRRGLWAPQRHKNWRA